MTTTSNRSIVIDTLAQIEELAGLISDIPDDLTQIQFHVLNSMCNRMNDLCARTRYRIGLIQDGKE